MKATSPVDPVMPGASATSESGLRPWFGVDMINRLSTTCPKVADVVLSSGAAAVTSTAVVTSPTVNSMLTVACCCTSSRNAGCVAFRNPGASTVRAYLAGGKPGNM